VIPLKELKTAVAAHGKATGDDIKKEQDKIDSAKTKIDEQIKVLGDAREPYRSLGTMYQALEMQETGDVEGTKALLHRSIFLAI